VLLSDQLQIFTASGAMPLADQILER